MNVLFPQWQGNMDQALYHGAKVLESYVLHTQTYHTVAVPLVCNTQRESGVYSHRALAEQLRALADELVLRSPATVFTLGGGCDADTAAIAYCAKRYGNHMGVIWCDLHPDCNTPESSPSGKLCGMSLRTVLGGGTDLLTAALVGRLNPQQVALWGATVMDEEEKRYISSQSIPIFCLDLTEPAVQTLTTWVQDMGFHKLYIHIDCDSIIHSYTRGMPEQLPVCWKNWLAGLQKVAHCVGIGLTQYTVGMEKILPSIQEIFKQSQRGWGCHSG